jgi:hypothetical protein
MDIWYGFKEEDLMEPFDWDFIESLPRQVRVALQSYIRSDFSIGKAAEMSGLGFKKFDEVRAKAKVSIRAPELAKNTNSDPIDALGEDATGSILSHSSSWRRSKHGFYCRFRPHKQSENDNYAPKSVKKLKTEWKIKER